MNEVEIQLQDSSGMWRTYTITQNNSQMILMRMKELKAQHPDKRVRAITRDGKLVDML
jgi:ribulose bisphosphate carboxylase small subunit